LFLALRKRRKVLANEIRHACLRFSDFRCVDSQIRQRLNEGFFNFGHKFMKTKNITTPPNDPSSPTDAGSNGGACGESQGHLSPLSVKSGAAVRCSDLVRCPVIDTKIIMDKSVKKGVTLLKELSTSKLFSNHFRRVLNRLFFDSLEIKDVNSITVGTRVVLGCFIEKNYLKWLIALSAINRFFNRKVPFHREVYL
jgi:hypothetical protein